MAVSCAVPPILSSVLAGVTVTEVTSMGLTLTVAEPALPLLAVAVMVTVPTAFAVTLPSASTVATAVLLLLHVTVLTVAFAGATVAVSCAV